MSKWFEWLGGADLLAIAALLDKELLNLPDSLYILFWIVSLLLFCGLSIVAYMDFKKKTEREQENVAIDTIKFIISIVIIFILVYFSFFIAKLIIINLMKDTLHYPKIPLILFLASIILFPFIFYFDKIKRLLTRSEL